MPHSTAAKPLPVYMQVAELLARQIKAGHWRAGERLPTEQELAGLLDVAVGTLRKALALLSAQGILERIQGSGTYVKQVASSGLIYELFRLELTTGPGLPTAQILDLRRLRWPKEAPAHGCPPDGQAWRARRLRYLSQVPVALEEIWFAGRSAEKLLASELGDSMYRFYQQRYGTWIARVEDRIGVASVPDWPVSEFGVPAGECAGFIERVSWSATDAVVEYSRTWFDARVSRYSSRLSQ